MPAGVQSSNIYEHVLDHLLHITCNLEAEGTLGAPVNSLWRLLLSLPISLIGYLSSFYSSLWYSEDVLLLLCLWPNSSGLILDDRNKISLHQCHTFMIGVQYFILRMWGNNILVFVPAPSLLTPGITPVLIYKKTRPCIH